ncbi:MAG: type II secretion system protein, partial [Alphaproteobacteria bacterium]|nr:type II secretion system protein [Alphaproteobacteria bacterium]
MHCRAQTGRSMIEMLAVIAIIGILSVITFWGYEMAMARYRANEVIKNTNMFALSIENQF